MKRMLLALALLAASAVIFISCDPRISEKPDIAGQQFLRDALKTPYQKILINAGRDTQVFANDGTMFRFYPNSFATLTGTAIRNGVVEIELMEMKHTGDFIRNRTTTLTNNGTYLISGGQVDIKATKDNNPVKANRYGIGFQRDNFSNQSMGIFYGNTTGDGYVFWDNDINTVIPKTNELNGTYGYLFDSVSSFGFVNCDYWLGDSTSPRTNFKVNLPAGFNELNTDVYMAASDLNLVAPVQSYNSTTHSFSVNSGYKVPVGMNVKIVMIGTLGGQTKFAVSSLTSLAMNQEFTLTPVAGSKADILAALSAL